MIQCIAETEEDNFHYDPAVGEDLINFLGSLALWSTILQPVFGYGSLKVSSVLKNVSKQFIFYVNMTPSGGNVLIASLAVGL